MATSTDTPSRTAPPRRRGGAARTRSLMRTLHLVLGGVLGFLVYSPSVSDELQRQMVAFVVIPLLTITGLVIWQQAKLRRLFRRGPVAGAVVPAARRGTAA